MDQKPPAKLSPLIIFLVLLFNLIWIILVFMSCQVDTNTRREVTPAVDMGSLQVLEEVDTIEIQSRFVFTLELKRSHDFGQFDMFRLDYSIPPYRPPYI